MAVGFYSPPAMFCTLRTSRICIVLLSTLILSALAGCRSVESRIAPSNHRDWAPDQALLPRAEIDGDQIKVRNIRNCKYLTADDYVVDHYDKTFDLNKLRGVDFITMPFGPVPALAHTMVSFEFEGERPSDPPEHLAVSVEVRKEKGEETFNPLLGMAQQYEIMYVIADERDLLHRQAVVHDGPTYLYKTVATPDLARKMLIGMLERANELADEPEFYDLIRNNCTTNIAEHINDVSPGRLSYDLGVLLPGYSDQKAYAEGLLAGIGSFEQLKQRALINQRAKMAAKAPDFSVAIRQESLVR